MISIVAEGASVPDTAKVEDARYRRNGEDGDRCTYGSQCASRYCKNGHCACKDDIPKGIFRNDCSFWTVRGGGCDANFPPFHQASGKIKDYCQISCKNCMVFRTAVTSENCAIGLKVRIGKDCIRGEGGRNCRRGTGTITKCLESKKANVLWDDITSGYRIGYNGFFDLFISDDNICERVDPAFCQGVSNQTCSVSEPARFECPYTCGECECKDDPDSCVNVSHVHCEHFQDLKDICPFSCGVSGKTV